MLILAGSGFAAGWLVHEYFPIVVPSALAILFILFTPEKKLRQMDPATREKNARWMAFRQWTKDFPRLSDVPVGDAHPVGADPGLRRCLQHRRGHRSVRPSARPGRSE